MIICCHDGESRCSLLPLNLPSLMATRACLLMTIVAAVAQINNITFCRHLPNECTKSVSKRTNANERHIDHYTL